jgi:hypothetical protein
VLNQSNESVRNTPHTSERKHNHTLTVRDAARMFEAAGVARIERSIVNWCQPNRQGIPRLDSYYDPNERKYFITPQSAETAIAEEKARVASKAPQTPEAPEGLLRVPKGAERPKAAATPESESGDRVKALESEVLDLKITNKGKDFFIERLQNEYEGLIKQVVGFSHRIGQLETELLQLEKPKASTDPSAS